MEMLRTSTLSPQPSTYQVNTNGILGSDVPPSLDVDSHWLSCRSRGDHGGNQSRRTIEPQSDESDEPASAAPQNCSDPQLNSRQPIRLECTESRCETRSNVFDAIGHLRPLMRPSYFGGCTNHRRPEKVSAFLQTAFLQVL